MCETYLSRQVRLNEEISVYAGVPVGKGGHASTHLAIVSGHTHAPVRECHAQRFACIRHVTLQHCKGRNLHIVCCEFEFFV